MMNLILWYFIALVPKLQVKSQRCFFLREYFANGKNKIKVTDNSQAFFRDLPGVIRRASPRRSASWSAKRTVPQITGAQQWASS